MYWWGVNGGDLPDLPEHLAIVVDETGIQVEGGLPGCAIIGVGVGRRALSRVSAVHLAAGNELPRPPAIVDEAAFHVVYGAQSTRDTGSGGETGEINARDGDNDGEMHVDRRRGV